ncbi:AAA family ATPase [Ornithinimicrobium murale]|uniref:AAA family ATPase n=1 Tax=Ornithinimicrobium murale TaxID=1050153 RepID=UPI000E0DDF55|nr:AAA family ATPase [Ornithinimicrobium murale]
MRRLADAPKVTAPQQPAQPPREHVADPDLAAVLFAAWSGDPGVVVASPPGAGKTRLITHLAQQLATRAGLRVCVAAQTRAQAYDAANRIGALDQEVALLGGNGSKRPAGLNPNVKHLAGAPRLRTSQGVVVATTARWLWTQTDTTGADILLIDEAYQLTYADLAALGSLAPQIVMVGDPGQIDPVVTGPTHRWTGHDAGPQVPGPIGLIATHGEAITQHRLTRTWRLGPDTTALIQPAFYPELPFTSARPPITVRDRNGVDLPEITTATITATSEHDPVIAVEAAAHVRDLLGSRLVTEDAARDLTPQDIAVVTPHVNQASLTAAHLADLPGVLIGTANSVQGSERAAVVVVHPLTGHAEATPFNCDLGRTCVALSRHRAHARILIDSNATTVLDRALRDNPDHATTTQRELLSRLTTN